MPFGGRSSLIALLLCSSAAAQAAGETSSTWTDPPARAPEAGKPSAPPTPAAISEPRRQESKTIGKTSSAVRKTATRRAHLRVARRVPHLAPSPVPRVLAAASPRPTMHRYHAYRVYSAAGFPPDVEDERLDRLSSAVGSGYLVMRRRTVEYPDGRVIRYYRPADEVSDD